MIDLSQLMCCCCCLEWFEQPDTIKKLILKQDFFSFFIKRNWCPKTYSSKNTVTILFSLLCLYQFPSKIFSIICVSPKWNIVFHSLCACWMCRGRRVDASLTQRGVRLTSCGRDVDVDADLGDASTLQRSHTGVGAKVGELQVYDVQVGGPGGDVGVRLGDDHSLRAPQGTAVLQPAESQLLWWGRLHLGYSACCYLCCTDK